MLLSEKYTYVFDITCTCWYFLRVARVASNRLVINNRLIPCGAYFSLQIVDPATNTTLNTFSGAVARGTILYSSTNRMNVLFGETDSQVSAKGFHLSWRLVPQPSVSTETTVVTPTSGLPVFNTAGAQITGKHIHMGKLIIWTATKVNLIFKYWLIRII